MECSAGNRPLPKLFARTLVVCAASLVLWVAAGLVVYVMPYTDVLKRADVLVVLTPQGDRTEYAGQLMDQGLAGTPAISAPEDRDGNAGLCHKTS